MAWFGFWIFASVTVWGLTRVCVAACEACAIVATEQSVREIALAQIRDADTVTQTNVVKTH